jgi:hypothetical protein
MGPRVLGEVTQKSLQPTRLGGLKKKIMPYRISKLTNLRRAVLVISCITRPIRL